MWHQQAEVSGEEGRPLGAHKQEADLGAAPTLQVRQAGCGQEVDLKTWGV